ncbi:MAG: hypothetical protein AAF589_02755 [Planctomycetota bacterium]
MPPTSAKALRCESCGAALSADNPTCEYCGSHHDLPAYKPGALGKAPERVKSRRLIITLVFLTALTAGAIAASLYLLD